MTWITEDATPLLILCGLIAAVLLAVLYQTGRGVLLAPLGIVVALGVGVWVLERLIVTENEEVEMVVVDAVQALHANDLDGVLRAIGPDALELRTRAQAEMGRVDIDEAKITDTPRITINRLTASPTATVDFMGRIKGQMKMGVAGGVYVSRITLTLRHYEDGWKIVDFETERPVP